jgi:nucleoside-diphosphate-sugar epimerase
VSVWGSGEATREFLYVEDAAEGVVSATERFSGAQPVNLGAGFEISIRDLAEKIAEQVGFKGDLVFDVSKPDGQPRRSLDTTRARELCGFQASVDLDEGIRRAVDWYLMRDEVPSTAQIR